MNPDILQMVLARIAVFARMEHRLCGSRRFRWWRRGFGCTHTQEKGWDSARISKSGADLVGWSGWSHSAG